MKIKIDHHFISLFTGINWIDKVTAKIEPQKTKHKKFKIGDTVVATETRKIVSIVEHDSHPYRLSDGNWYTEEQLKKVGKE